MQSRGETIRLILRSAIGFIILIMIAISGRSIIAQTGDSEFHQTYPIDSGGSVRLTNSSGSVRINSWSENRVKVDAVKTGRRGSDFSQVRIEVTATAGQIEIRTVYPRGRSSGVSVDYQLTVPRTVNLESITTASGEISVTGPALRVTANTASGDIRVRNIDQDAVLSTASGNVNIQKTGGDLRVKTASGDIVINDAGSHLFAQAATGSITVRNVRGDASLSSSNGNIRVEGAGGKVNARATSGSIVILDAGGDVQADSLSDNLMISKVKGRVSATTLSGNITLEDIQEGIRARAVSGKIQITRSSGRIDAGTTSDAIILTETQSREIIARTTSGEVRFSGALLPDGNYDFESFSGNVIVFLPADAGFNLTARANRNNLNSDFDLKTEGTLPSPRRGTFIALAGNGGPDLRVATFSGSIHLKKR